MAIKASSDEKKLATVAENQLFFIRFVRFNLLIDDILRFCFMG